jgi:hypothetical protein
MALITGLPNFFSTAKPVQSDFNNAGKAILQQLGGQYYDEGLTGYVISNGNIDTTNIVANAGFRNAQKSEARSLSTCSSVAAVTAGAFTSYPMFGPFLFDCTIIGIGMIAVDGTYYVSDGRFSIYLNNAPLISYAVSGNSGTTVSGAAGDPSYVNVNIQIRMGDSIMFDPLDGTDNPAAPMLFSTATRVQGAAPATVAVPGDLNVSLYMVGQHTK